VSGTPVRRLTRREFREFCCSLALKAPRQGGHYLDFHFTRLWSTYQDTFRFLKPGDRFLSVGAGSAYVEAALVASMNVSGVVVDFPETIEECGRYYEACQLEAVAADLSSASALEMLESGFQFIFSCEIVEHIPAAPHRHFGLLAPLLERGGHLLVTTPNAGSLAHIVKTVLHVPTLPEPERFFGPVCYENEGVHRREYMRSEIESALRQCGISPVRTSYIWYNRTQSLFGRIALPSQIVLPPLRPAMNVIGRRMTA
jgi:hypothetical protein